MEEFFIDNPKDMDAILLRNNWQPHMRQYDIITDELNNNKFDLKRLAAMKKYCSQVVFALIPHLENETIKSNEKSFSYLTRNKNLFNSLRDRIQVEIDNYNLAENKQEPLFKTTYSEAQLKKIFSRLEEMNVVEKSDLNKFLGLFTGNFSGPVFWNDKVRGAPTGLFYFIKKLTGNDINASYLKKCFYSNITIHDKSNTKSRSMLIHLIMKDI